MAVVLADHGPRPGRDVPAALRRGVPRRRRDVGDAHVGDAARLHRALRRRGRVPDAPLQHRRRGPALHGRDRRRRRRARDRRLADRDRDRADVRRAARSAARSGRSIPGVLRAFFATNEIITSLMLNYVAALILTYLIFDSQSYWRDTSTLRGEHVPAGQDVPALGDLAGARRRRARRPARVRRSRSSSPLVLAFLYARTRFGFEVQVIGDSPRAARYAGMRTRRKIVVGDVPLGRDRRARRREPGRRLPPPARPARADRRRTTATPGS